MSQTSDFKQNPYVGPRPFERQDSKRFFGRNQEANELLSLIVAHRTVVLYAQSGAGKTSLLNAQVVPMLEAEGFEVWPFARVQGPELTSVSPDQITNIYTFHTLLSWVSDEENSTALVDQTINNFLSKRPHIEDEFGFVLPRVVIFDQFEELFTAYPARWQEREGFFSQIGRALQGDPLLRVVFSLREDYVAQFEPYTSLIPRSLRTRFRLERMRLEAALAAVRDPLHYTSRHFAPGVAERLVKDLRTARVELLAGETDTVIGEFVEPVQLQVVCQNLWNDLPENVTEITETHLQTFGNVDQALSSFYERAIDRALPYCDKSEAELRNWFETLLITPAGTRGIVFRGAEETGGIGNSAIEVLENMHIIRGEFRAGSRWYELTHDRLIEPIQQSNRKWYDARQSARIRRIQRTMAAIIGTLIFVAFCGFVFFYIQGLQAVASSDGEMNETATAVAEEVQITATAQYDLNATYTADAVMQATSLAATALAQSTLNAELATAAFEATSTAIVRVTAEYEATITAVARATVDYEATKIAEELARLSQPIRPLRPGISIGASESSSAGTLSAFVRDEKGLFYLLGSDSILGEPGATIFQPSPIDGGGIENSVAQNNTTRPLQGSTRNRIPAVLLVNKAQLISGISFQTTVPELGPVLGVKEPVPNTIVSIVGRTSGFVEAKVITCPDNCEIQTREGTIFSPFAVAETLAPGDEGALILDRNGFAVGVVVQTGGTTYSLIAPMQAVLDELDVQIVSVGQELYVLNNHKNRVRSVVFSPDGKLLASAGDDAQIFLWDVESLDMPLTRLADHKNWVYTLAFSPDGKLLASGSADWSVRLWDITNLNTPPIVLKEHSSEVWAVAFSPDGKTLASAGTDNTIRLWNVENLEEGSRKWWEGDTWVRDIAFSPDGRWLAAISNDNTVRLWDLKSESGSIPIILWEGNELVLSIAFSPDGRWLATAHDRPDQKVRLWDLIKSELGTEPNILAGHVNGIKDVAFSLDGTQLATGSTDNTIRLWSLTNLDHITSIPIQGHTGVINAVAFSPNGIWLASAGGENDYKVRIWQVR